MVDESVQMSDFACAAEPVARMASAIGTRFSRVGSTSSKIGWMSAATPADAAPYSSIAAKAPAIRARCGRAYSRSRKKTLTR